MAGDRPADQPASTDVPDAGGRGSLVPDTPDAGGSRSTSPGESPPAWGWTPSGWGTSAPGAPAAGWPPPAPSDTGWAPPGWGQGPQSPPPWSAPPPGYLGPGGPRRRNPLAVIALVVGALVIAAAVGVPAALLTRGSPSSTNGGSTTPRASPTPGPTTAQAQAQYRQVLTASEQSAGFHYVAVSSLPGGGGNQTISGDSGQKDGTQQITETTDYGSEQFSLVLTPDQNVYFQGNTPALEDQLGVVAGSAAALDGKWILVSLGDGPYAQLEVGITTTSQLQEDTFVPTATATVQGSGGAALTKVSGTVPAGQEAPEGGSAYFELPPGSHLPTTYYQDTTGVGTLTTTFSAWGKAPSVSAPSSSQAWSTLSTSEPPGGYGSGGAPGQGSSSTPAPSPTPTPTPSPGGPV